MFWQVCVVFGRTQKQGTLDVARKKNTDSENHTDTKALPNSMH